MRVLIIRHAEPYYPTDSLTEKGIREAELLSNRLVNEHIDYAYVSPHGRAKMTAEPTLKKTGLKASELEWLREFPLGLKTGFHTKFNDDDHCAWNMPPESWVNIPDIFDPVKWRNADIYKGTGIVERYDIVCSEFDKLIASHGFINTGHYFKVKDGYEDSRQTIALFCHMGLGNLLLSHILGVSLPAVWHTMFLPTSSVTTIFMEQHLEDGKIAKARIFQAGDTSHLLAGGEPVSPSGLHSYTIY